MGSQIIIYQAEDGKTKIDVRLEGETVWLSQRMMAELFQTTPQNITLHFGNIYEEHELEEVSTCKDFLQVQKEGNRGKPCGAKHLANTLRRFSLTLKRLEDLAHACAILNCFHIFLPASTCLISLPKKNWLPKSNAKNFSLNSSGDYEIGL